jgi:hypothetical protein
MTYWDFAMYLWIHQRESTPNSQLELYLAQHAKYSLPSLPSSYFIQSDPDGQAAHLLSHCK